MPKPLKAKFESLTPSDMPLYSYVSAILGGTIRRTDPNKPLPEIWHLPVGGMSTELQTSRAKITLSSGVNPETSEEWVSAMLVLSGGQNQIFEGETFTYRLQGGSMTLSRPYASPLCSVEVASELQPLNWDARTCIRPDGQIDQAKLRAYMKLEAAEREQLEQTTTGDVEAIIRWELATAAQLHGFETQDEFEGLAPPAPLPLPSRIDG